MKRSVTAAALATTTAALVLAGCSDDDPMSTGGSAAGDVHGDPRRAAPDRRRPGATSLDIALSQPQEDSHYPDVGDPGVDALHYDLAWAGPRVRQARRDRDPDLPLHHDRRLVPARLQ